VGADFKIQLSEAEGSMSVLVPGQDDLRHRACVESTYYDLLEWFAACEIYAWKVVDAYHQDNRPERIFLVYGQTLTSEYSISHIVHSSYDCEVKLDVNAGMPIVADAHMLLGWSLKRVHAAKGFEVRNRPAPGCLYSVFMEVRDSGPIQTILRKDLQIRVSKMYEYLAIHYLN